MRKKKIWTDGNSADQLAFMAFSMSVFSVIFGNLLDFNPIIFQFFTLVFSFLTFTPIVINIYEFISLRYFK